MPDSTAVQEVAGDAANISPCEVAAARRRVTQVWRRAVLGVPHPANGETVHAIRGESHCSGRRAGAVPTEETDA
ncbi:hypothetical protein [Salinispora tropica]|uniref:hypothetical protein n=1 Tax=Salinispora tropica TaxID=168695 RepID=UPI0002F30865|nr:hypothetical protein [Salinispora tropica]